jgi:hypothetical protein
MTVIAYRHGVMACDSCWANAGTQIASMIKIKRLSSGALLGQAGDNDARAVERLFDKIKNPDHLPTCDELAATHVSFEGLLALPRGGVFAISICKVDETGWVVTEDDEEAENGVWQATSMGGYAAIGSGSDFALAAMDAGAPARTAVEIACRRSIHCRLPVHALSLHAGRQPLATRKTISGNRGRSHK